jgi:glyoxylase-like metal-dependent hydrolase (beta-lactamase superfamily II)
VNFVFEQLRAGGDRNFAYLVGDRAAHAAAVVDPSYDPDGVVARATAQGLEVRIIVNTHGHPDHTNGNDRARELTGAPVAAFRGSPAAADLPLDDGSELRVGGLVLRFLHTPGHCDDHLVVYLPSQKVAITGDLLFVGKVGGTQSDELARIERTSLERVLSEIPDEATVWPGHDYGCRPASTIALERATNPFLRCATLEEFLALKRGWAQFKQEHGLR